MITKAQEALLEAIKAALFDTEPNYPDGVDWDEVIREAKAQTVLGLISPVIPVQNESLTEAVDSQKAAYMRILYEQDQLVRLLDAHQIPFVILKGCAAAVYYPKPYLRAMGDVDLLVPRDKFEDAMRVMEGNGYKCIGRKENGKVREGARHLEYEKNGIEFELHYHFSSEGFDIDDILEKAIERREYRNLNGFCFPVLPEVENGLVFLGHINHHLHEGGIGLRQVVDWEMYFNVVMNGRFWREEFVPSAKEKGLLKLAVSITRMCNKYLCPSKKTDKKDHEADDTSDILMEIALIYGNFGRGMKLESMEREEHRMFRSMHTIRKKGFFSYCLDNGMATWKITKEYPILKPLAFLWGMLRFVGRALAAVLKTGHLRRGIQDGKRKEELYRKIGVKG